jgi:4-alpha-glucanotransferase
VKGNGGRASGILLHPTSLPGPRGIGELGVEAYRFLDYLVSAGQSLWQVLPLGPTGYGDSPYACFSSFAGNPLLVSLDTLVEWGVLQKTELERAAPFARNRVDFGPLIEGDSPPPCRAAFPRTRSPGKARGLRRVQVTGSVVAEGLRAVHGRQERFKGRRVERELGS